MSQVLMKPIRVNLRLKEITFAIVTPV